MKNVCKKFRTVALRCCGIASVAFILSACAGREKPTDIAFNPEDPNRRVALYGIVPEVDTDAARGKYLIESVAACGTCHGDGTPKGALTGGRTIAAGVASVVAPPLSGSVTLRSWTEGEIIDAIRLGVRKNDSDIAAVFHGGYEWMSDRDVRSIVAYLRGGDVPTRFEELQPLATKSTLDIRVGADSDFRGYVNSVPRAPTAQYGRYLSFQVARCQVCHSVGVPTASSEEAFTGKDSEQEGVLDRITTSLQSGFTIYSASDSEPVADDAETMQFPKAGPDIRSSEEGKLTSWSEQNIVSYLSSGKRPDGSRAEKPGCLIPFYQSMSGNDKLAIARYIKSL